LINTESVPEINRLQPLDPAEHSGLPLLRITREQDTDLPLNEIQKRHIIRTLNKYNGNISLSAKALGIARNTLYRNIEVFKIDCSTFDQ